MWTLSSALSKGSAVFSISLLEVSPYLKLIVYSLQTYLSIGDYDGDTATVIWDPDIVQPFVNADEKHSIVPPGLSTCFSTDNERVDDFLRRVDGETEERKVSAMQVFLLGALRDTSLVGKYSSMHDNSIYKNGYANPRTVKLAYKYGSNYFIRNDPLLTLFRFCTILDGAKTGLKVLPDTLRADMKDYHHVLGPKWKSKPKKDGPTLDQSNSTFLKRNSLNQFVKGKFIMDVLVSAAKQESVQALRHLDQIFAPLASELDPHLAQPWQDAVASAERGSAEAVKRKRKDLSIISLHVKSVYKEHKQLGGNAKSGSGGGVAFTNQPIEARQDWLRSISKKFAAFPRPEDMDIDSMIDAATIARLRASYAYCFDYEESKASWSRFPWNVAMRDLCTLKASALGPYKTLTNGFYERLKIVSARRT